MLTTTATGVSGSEKFLQYVARQIGTLRQPFFAAEFTLSSHHPFRVPEEYQKVLPKGTIPMHQAVAYTDMALRKFFETASKQLGTTIPSS